MAANPKSKKSRKPIVQTPVNAEWLPLSVAREIISFSSTKFETLISQGIFDCRDFRMKSAIKPSWRVSRKSLDRYVASRPRMKFSNRRAAARLEQYLRRPAKKSRKP